MNIYLLGIVTILYLGVAIDFYFKHNIGMMACFIGYAIANLGMMYSTR